MLIVLLTFLLCILFGDYVALLPFAIRIFLDVPITLMEVNSVTNFEVVPIGPNTLLSILFVIALGGAWWFLWGLLVRGWLSTNSLRIDLFYFAGIGTLSIATLLNMQALAAGLRAASHGCGDIGFPLVFLRFCDSFHIFWPNAETIPGALLFDILFWIVMLAPIFVWLRRIKTKHQ